MNVQDYKDANPVFNVLPSPVFGRHYKFSTPLSLYHTQRTPCFIIFSDFQRFNLLFLLQIVMNRDITYKYADK